MMYANTHTAKPTTSGATPTTGYTNVQATPTLPDMPLNWKKSLKNAWVPTTGEYTGPTPYAPFSSSPASAFVASALKYT